MKFKVNGKPAEKRQIRKGNQTLDVKGESATFDAVVNKRVQTLDDLIKVAKIDTNEWLIERWICNKWEVAAKLDKKEMFVQDLWQVKAFLKRNKPVMLLK